jgi:hypothetical protein
MNVNATMYMAFIVFIWFKAPMTLYGKPLAYVPHVEMVNGMRVNH